MRDRVDPGELAFGRVTDNESRRDILDDVDVPMLQHGLKEMDGGKLCVPRSRELKPRREFLEMRYESFRKAG